MGEQLILTGLFLEKIEKEQEYYLKRSSYKELQRFIPGAYVKNIEESREKVTEHVLRFVLGRGILYCIRIKENRMPLGYILINSPVDNVCCNEWNLDFWLGPNLSNGGIMSLAIPYVLDYLRDMGVKVLHTQVDKENYAAIHLLEKIGFGDVSHMYENLRLSQDYILYGGKL